MIDLSSGADENGNDAIFLEPRRTYDEIKGEIEGEGQKAFFGEIWLEAGTTYTFLVVTEAIEASVTIGEFGYSRLDASTGYSAEEFTFTATATGFQDLTVTGRGRNADDDGSFALYMKAPGAENGQYWGVLGHTEGRSADLNASTLTAAEVAALGGGVSLIGAERGENLTGSVGNEIIVGGDGLDVIDGGLGNDVLVGGKGADRFRLGTETGLDLITEEKASDYDFTVIEYDGFIEPKPGAFQVEVGDNANDVLIAFRTPEGQGVIGSIELTDFENPSSANFRGSLNIEASIVLPAALRVSDTLLIRDDFGSEVTFSELEARTNAFINGSETISAGYSFTPIANGGTPGLVSRAIQDWTAQWVTVSAQPQFQRALADYQQPDILRDTTLDAFLKNEGVVLSSQAVFDLDEAFEKKLLSNDLLARFGTDSDGDAVLSTERTSPAVIDKVGDTYLAISTANGFTFAGFVKINGFGAYQDLISFNLSNGTDIKIGYFTSQFWLGQIGIGLPRVTTDTDPNAGFDILSGSGPDQRLIYDTNNKFDALRPGESLTDSFIYKVRDEAGAEVAAEVTLEIFGVNTAPNAADDSATTARDQPTFIDVLANDSDAEGGVLTVREIVADPLVGSATIEPDGKINYDPLPRWFGTDSFVYSVSDDGFGAAQATVSVDVAGPSGLTTGPVQRDADNAASWDARFDILNATSAKVGDVTIFDDGRITEVTSVDGVRATTDASDPLNVRS